jgi:prolyl-tRNA editing enzyme YbaK/EbsC (Cys-tRNA(Pro) deacylase)
MDLSVVDGSPGRGGEARVGVALVDRDLLAYGELWAAAGTPHAVFPTAPDELVRITGGTVVDLREER